MGEKKKISNPLEEFNEISSAKSLYTTVFVYLFFGVLYGFGSAMVCALIVVFGNMLSYREFSDIDLTTLVIIALILPTAGYIVSILSMIKKPGIKTRVILRIGGYSIGFFSTAFILAKVLFDRM